MTRAVSVLLLLGLLSLGAPAAEGRVVAVGDVHGAYPELLSILRSAGLADAEGHWTGGDAVLVQTGDLLDRGPRVRDVLDLLRRLQEEADAAGGRVEVLLGNHEQMTLIREYRDVAEATWDEFAGEESEERREEAWTEWTAWARRRAEELGGRTPAIGRELRESWLAEHPLGFLEYVEAFGPEGEYGRWLRRRPVATEIGGTLFLHAGISPARAGLSLDALNRREADFFARLDADRRALVEAGVILPFFTLAEVVHLVREEAALEGADDSPRRRAVLAAADTFDLLDEHLGEDSLFWYRGWSRLEEAALAPLAARLRETLGVERFVAGHTPARDGKIHTRLGGLFAFIDTGMLTERYGGRPSALELAGGGLRALYVDAPAQPLEPATVPAGAGARPDPRPVVWRMQPDDEREQATAAAVVWRGLDGEPLPFTDESEIERFLAEAPVVSDERIPVGITKPRKLRLERDGISLHAAFRYHHDEDRNVRLGDGTRQAFFIDSFRNEVAAYRLSRLLGMRNVPPAVRRAVDRKDGSLQLWVEGVRTQKDVQDEGLAVPGDKILWRNRQSWDMKVFDNLINNIDRNAGNILWDTEWGLWLIDHTRAFARGSKLPRPDDVHHCSRRLLAGLESLDETTLEREMEGLLGRYEVRTLLDRRDALVERIRRLAGERGEEAVLFEWGDPGATIKVSYDEG